MANWVIVTGEVRGARGSRGLDSSHNGGEHRVASERYSPGDKLDPVALSRKSLSSRRTRPSLIVPTVRQTIDACRATTARTSVRLEAAILNQLDAPEAVPSLFTG